MNRLSYRRLALHILILPAALAISVFTVLSLLPAGAMSSDMRAAGGTPTATPTPSATATVIPTCTPFGLTCQQPTATPLHVIVSTDPEGLAFSVGATTYNSTQHFWFDHHSSITISTTSPQDAGEGVRYVFHSWSNGAPQTHQWNRYGGLLIARFTKQYLLDMRANSGGIGSPPTGFFNAGQSIEIRATPYFPGCYFHHWDGYGEGSYTGTNNPAMIVMNGPIRQVGYGMCPPPSATPPSTPIPTPTPTKAAFDYDGDGKSDISVFRPSDGVWYLRQSTAGFYAINFGFPTDRIAPADYDGDGRTDVAVYRPEEGIWYIAKSSDGTFVGVRFGLAGDLPAPADYDGDGKADLAVFRQSEGMWYIANSYDGTFTIYRWGQDGDRPTVGDFDGDRKADIAIYRPSAGIWYRVNSSTGGFYGHLFGGPNEKSVPGDYDGDGKTDLGVYRNDGVWTVIHSSTGFMTGRSSLNTDIPAPGDFDGDGRTDYAWFRPSNGSWAIENSLSGSTATHFWGLNGDQPTHGAFGN